MKKVNKILIAIALIMVTFLVSNSVFAATISRTFSTYNNGNGRPSGFYAVLARSSDVPLIKIVEQGNATNNSVYCFKGGNGFGDGNVAEPREYTQSMSLLQSRSSFVSQYPGYESAIPSTVANYNSAVSLLAIFADTSSATSINAMIAKVKDSSDNFTYSDFDGYSGITTSGYQKDIVEAVQQAALWYFTNPNGDNYHPKYDLDNNIEPTFKYSTSNGGYTTLHTKYRGSKRFDYGYGDLYDPAEYLFMKLVDYGIAHKNTDPSTYASTASGSSFDKSQRTVVDLGDGYSLVGPYTFTLSSAATLASATINVTNYTMYKANKTTVVSGNTFADKLRNVNGQQFYLKVPNSVDTTNLTISINTTRTTNEINCLTVGANNLSVNQPLVEYGSKTTPENFSDTVSITATRKFDLALRKYITKINGTNVTVNREPQITAQEVRNLYNENAFFNSDKEPRTAKTTAKKTHTKDPLEVQTGDTVLYAIRIYNEGNVDGYCTEITDYLPDGLTLKQGSTINETYGWTADQTGKVVKTTNLKSTLLSKVTSSSTSLSSAFVQIECTVTAQPSTSRKNLINVAEITAAKDVYNGTEDRDSTPNNLTSAQKSNYMPGTSTNGKGYEDDDDYEPLYLTPKYFDLALRKFITKINGTNVAVSREPSITAADLTALRNEDATKTFDNGTTAYKRHTKDPLLVETNDVVLYTIRIYNEGSVNGYATKVTDYLPEGLALKQNSTINSQYGWTANGREISTTHLGNRVIDAFNGTTLDYEDLQIECVVTETNGNQVKRLKNVAEITAAKDIYNNTNDRDSTPDNLSVGNINNYNVSTSRQGKGYEDDDDYEDLYLQPEKFDLALRKFITKINGSNVAVSREPVITQEDLVALATEDATKTFDNGTTSYKRHTKDPLEVKTGDSVIYTIRIYNEGSVDGYCTEIVDYLPVGLKFKEDSALNRENGWTANGQEIRTRKLENTILRALSQNNGRYDIASADVQIECTVEETASSQGKHLKNVAEITESRNNLNLEDIDSEEDNLTNGQRDDYNPGTSTNGKGYEDDDDYEDLYLKPVEFDLALRKFITKVNGSAVAVSREPVITQENLRALANGDTQNTFDGTTTFKRHTKDPIQVKTADSVIYTIRVYNEGSVDGYCKELVDYLPVGLKYKEDSELNRTYGWTANGQEIRTDYLKDTLIKALAEENGTYTISYVDVEIECTVEAKAGAEKVSLKNVAEITESDNELGLEDRDSEEDNITKGQRDDYNPGTSRDGKGYEDDDDYEELILVRFDLALRKFITKVNDKDITDRIPVVDTSKFGTVVDGKEVTTCEYKHPKDAVLVGNTDVVVYTIRIYNEGNVDGYCESVKDDIPQGLTYLPDHAINKQYGWTLLDKDGNATTTVSDAKYVITDYLKDTLIRAFDKDTMDSPDYKDVQVAFKVDEPTLATPNSRELINHAQIRKSLPDIDSTPDEWIEGEDDQDIEKVKVLYFDLSLRKWVTHAIVIEDGKTKVMETGHKAEDDPESIVKVELNHDRLKNTVVKFQYSIRIKNEGEIEGYCTEISDYIPEGLKFVAEDNKNWKEVDGKVVTDQLKDTLLKPGETAEVTITLTWINNENNMGVKINTAEISKDKNKYNAPDIDSTPNNRKAGEDDIDDAPVALVVMTGAAQSMVLIGIAALAVVGTGIVLIKKYVI